MAVYKIILPQSFTGERYGVSFTNGTGVTDSDWIVAQLRLAGFAVEDDKNGEKRESPQAKKKISKS